MNYVLICFLEYLLYSNVHFSVTSARRTPDQNKACNGSPTSQHLVGEAIDLKPCGSTTYDRLLEHIHKFSDGIHVFDQLILYSTFIHISFGSRNRHQVIDKRIY